ncbi:MBOAT family O-acyltransferase [Pedobacter kyonggii]|uniref:Acyltransferase n=1 Tax=Pedobacter kyonggii TaxID=1926871 RepID=A0A4Q9H678_9SPHI|nr:MBOAT family O-acyltransferase [Pedobacter kyonggii]TBO36400.1 acyltransferase [Pedobacter kyonggii]
MKLYEYVKKRNGVPIGHPSSLRNNLQRSLGAKNFSAFWNFRNPIFGYYLGRKVFKPLKEILPSDFALILTFVFCGMVHDLVTTLIRGRLSFFFSVWFMLMGIAVIITQFSKYDLSEKKWTYNAVINLLIIGICVLITILLNNYLKFY